MKFQFFLFINEYFGTRSKYHGQGHVIIFHRYCEVLLLVHVLDNSFWHNILHMIYCLHQPFTRFLCLRIHDFVIMTSWHGNAIRTIGALWKGSACGGCIPLKNPVVRSFDVFVLVSMKKLFIKWSYFRSVWAPWRSCDVPSLLLLRLVLLWIRVTSWFEFKKIVDFVPNSTFPVCNSRLWREHPSYCRTTASIRPLGSLSAVGLCRTPHLTTSPLCLVSTAHTQHQGHLSNPLIRI